MYPSKGKTDRAVTDIMIDSMTKQMFGGSWFLPLQSWAGFVINSVNPLL